MDIALHCKRASSSSLSCRSTNRVLCPNLDFDELAGDALYAKLWNPLAELASALSNVSSSPAATSLKGITTYLSRLPGLEELPRDDIVRQTLSLCLITYFSVLLMYFSVAGFSYYFIFDHRSTSLLCFPVQAPAHLLSPGLQ
jgi:hypothetical protein